MCGVRSCRGCGVRTMARDGHGEGAGAALDRERGPQGKAPGGLEALQKPTRRDLLLQFRHGGERMGASLRPALQEVIRRGEGEPAQARRVSGIRQERDDGG